MVAGDRQEHQHAQSQRGRRRGGAGLGLRPGERAGAEEDTEEVQPHRQGCKKAGPRGAGMGRDHIAKGSQALFYKAP